MTRATGAARPRLRIIIAATGLACALGSAEPARAVLTFSVSVCPTDIEYSFACRERALAEAAKRLGQIYLEVYRTRRPEGTLRVWFTLPTPPPEQLRFLRDAEERAIKTVAARLLTEITQQTPSPSDVPSATAPGVPPTTAPGVGAPDALSPGTSAPGAGAPDATSPGASSPEDTIRKRTQQVEKWRLDANLEARRGSNWLHDWASKTHSYRTGEALRELARLKPEKQNPSGN
ncbi:MAG TPA: hypothetical protein VET85_06035 [Stellaceae bacterium]|nr:hypothetical protein [Stellaceae bacterium]